MKIESKQVFETLKGLKNSGYVALISLYAEDLSPISGDTEEFMLVYTLYNPVTKDFQEIETTVNKEIHSVSTLYKSANYDEREIYDLFGINFKNHPNLKRIFLDENFEGHPLKNNYKMPESKIEKAK